MQRIAFKMKLSPGFQEEYKKRHDDIWPELKNLLSSKGIEDYSIFFDKETNSLFGILKIEDEGQMETLPSYPIMQKWWSYMKDIMESNPDNSPVSVPLTEMFYLP
ncbi:MAG TPA: L-rhamnose mutarotase [Puia sp.]